MGHTVKEYEYDPCHISYRDTTYKAIFALKVYASNGQTWDQEYVQKESQDAITKNVQKQVLNPKLNAPHRTEPNNKAGRVFGEILGHLHNFFLSARALQYRCEIRKLKVSLSKLLNELKEGEIESSECENESSPDDSNGQGHPTVNSELFGNVQSEQAIGDKKHCRSKQCNQRTPRLAN